jgi:hypothetical protein
MPANMIDIVNAKSALAFYFGRELATITAKSKLIISAI